MLTAKQLIGLYRKGVEICYRRNNPRDIRGEYDQGTLEATVFLPAGSKEERAVTTLHELIHARNDQTGSRGFKVKLTNAEERAVEREAQETYRSHPGLIDFIVELWDLPY